MSAEEFAKHLGITKEGQFVDNVYVISLDNSNEYSKVYTLLDKSDELDLDIEKISLDVKNSLITYLSDNYDVKLVADFDENIYTVTFEEVDE